MYSLFVLQLRRGFVAVVNRSQKDIKENLPIEDARVQVRGCAAQPAVFAAAFLSLVACLVCCLLPGLVFLLCVWEHAPMLDMLDLILLRHMG